MTAQAMDSIIYRGREYALLGVDKEGLAKPQDFGMMPEMMHTACYRGFFSTYEIREDGIYLNRMTVHAKDGSYKPINGVWPTMNDEFQIAIYENIDLLINFSGRMRLGADFIEDLYIHQGFQKPSAFRTVIDLKFEDGRIIETMDRSQDVEEIRGSFKKRYDRIGFGILKFWKFFKRAYSQDMDELE